VLLLRLVLVSIYLRGPMRYIGRWGNTRGNGLRFYGRGITPSRPVVCLGRALLALDQELHLIVTDSRRRHKGPTPKYGFRRGPGGAGD
jgi:hypothetical protein